MSDDEFHGPWAVYGEGRFYRRVCPVCCRYVKADESISVNWLTEIAKDEPNATCREHGRVEMPFEGWADDLLPENV